MYQNLLTAIKTRILSEVEDSFNTHPAFSGKVVVSHKYPYQERTQMGVILRNTSASMFRVSADNYMADSISHVRLARDRNYPGLAIEWARENDKGVTGYMNEEDVSDQLGPTQRMFLTSEQIVSGDSNTDFANNIGQVRITINGEKVFPEFINGEKRLVLLSRATEASDVVKISYYYRSISNPGIYIIDFIEHPADSGTIKFIVIPDYVIEKELVLENITGTEVSASLENSNIDNSTDDLYIQSKNGGPQIELTRDTDYTIDYVTGSISLLNPLTKGYNLYASYRWQPTDYVNGPYSFDPYQENHTVIPGVVLAIGRRAKIGDRQVIVIEKNREPQARIYGGLWDMSLDLAVIAKDPIQSAEMADHVISYLWGLRKNVLEWEGINLMSVEPSGESEESFDDNTGDVYYTTSVSITLQAQWQEFIPYLYEIKRVVPTINFTPNMPEFYVYKDNKLSLTNIIPDTRKVIKYPTIGYEKVT
jgi:hypothetical protein